MRAQYGPDDSRRPRRVYIITGVYAAAARANLPIWSYDFPLRHEDRATVVTKPNVSTTRRAFVPTDSPRLFRVSDTNRWTGKRALADRIDVYAVARFAPRRVARP